MFYRKKNSISSIFLDSYRNNDAEKDYPNVKECVHKDWYLKMNISGTRLSQCPYLDGNKIGQYATTKWQTHVETARKKFENVPHPFWHSKGGVRAEFISCEVDVELLGEVLAYFWKKTTAKKSSGNDPSMRKRSKLRGKSTWRSAW